MDIPEDVQIQMAQQCQKSLKFLCRDIFDMREWGGLHDEIELFLNMSGKRKMLLVPRGHLKSSVVTIGWTIQQLLRAPNSRTLIANAVWDNARHFLWKIQDYLTDKSQLPFLFGAFESKKWNSDEIVIRQRTRASAEPSIATTGVEKAQASQHYDNIVMDDLVIRENISTVEQRNRVINFYRDTLDLLEPKGTLVIIGTRWAMGDLYQHIIENEMSTLNGHVFESEEDRINWRQYVAA